MFVNKTLVLTLFCLLIISCGDQTSTESGMPNEEGVLVDVKSVAKMTTQSPQGPSADKIVPPVELGFERLAQPRLGDLDRMEKDRLIRVLTVYGLGRYFLDGGQEKGLVFDLFKKFEKATNKHLGKGHLKLHVIFIPVSRDELIPALIEGRGDIVAAGLTITAERDKLIDFTNPASKKLSEVLVTGPSAPAVNNIDDLAGHTIYVRASSSYRSSIDALNRRFKKEGRQAIRLEDASEVLEDEDILEMVNSGLIEWAL